MISTIFTEGEFLYWKKNEGYLQICPAMLDRISKVFTQILQGGYYGVNLELQLVLFDLDAPDPLLHVALLLLGGTESQHEVLGALRDGLPPLPRHKLFTVVRELAAQKLVEDDAQGPTVGLRGVHRVIKVDQNLRGHRGWST